MRDQKRWHRSNHRQELCDIRKAAGMITNEGVRLRMQNLLFLLIRESHCAKIKYVLFTVISVMLSVAIMIITSAGTGLAIWGSEAFGTAANLLVAVLAGGVNVSCSILAVTGWRENWIRCRYCADRIEEELFRYLAREKPYQHPDNRNGKLLRRVERIAACKGTRCFDLMWSKKERTKGKQKNDQEKRRENTMDGFNNYTTNTYTCPACGRKVKVANIPVRTRGDAKYELYCPNPKCKELIKVISYTNGDMAPHMV